MTRTVQPAATPQTRHTAEIVMAGDAVWGEAGTSTPRNIRTA